MKMILDIIAYSIVISMGIILITLMIISMRMAAREREYNKQHADEWNERVKRMQAKGRWNDVE